MKDRKVNKMPYKVLDAPNIHEDFYLNLVDWSSSNVLAVGLQGEAYVWSASTCQVKKLCEVNADEDMITSVNWSQSGQYLAVGTHTGATQIWDAEQAKCVRSFAGHTGRISSIAWNGDIISTGSRDRSIQQRDLRSP